MPKAEKLNRINEQPDRLPLANWDNEYDPTATSAPNTPTGVAVKTVQEGILITVDFNLDTAHLHPRFQAFIVYARPLNDDATDDSGYEVGRFSDSDWVWQQESGGYTGWELALSAVSNTGYESARTAWYPCFLSTFYDDFSSYGGDQVSNLESLYWLKIADFDSDEAWIIDIGTMTSETYNYKEGDRGIRITASSDLGGGNFFGDIALSGTWDFSNEGRFGDDDYVLIALYSNVATNAASILFYTNRATPSYYQYGTGATLSAGWNFIKVKKSQFTANNSPSWADITYIDVTVLAVAGTNYVIVDDLRIVKADPDDATTYNDTGPTWDFNGGEWHVYEGNRAGEPDHAYSLGQIESAAGEDYFATIPSSSIPNGRVSVGLQLKYIDGRAAVVFRVEDSTFGDETLLAAEVDSSADKIYLVRFTDGARSVLATADITFGLHETVWLGVDFRDLQNEDRILVYTAWQEHHLWEGGTLGISHATTAPWPVGDKVGLMSGYYNVRFFNFRAGSPQVADYAHKAGYAITAGYTVESPTALASFLALPGLVGYWPMSSVQRSTGNVYDLSGQGRTLTYNGNPTFNIYNELVAYIDLDGTGDYLSRADETDLDILGTETIYAAALRGLTVGGWFWQDAWGAGTHLIAKDDAASNRSFALRSDDLYPALLVNGTISVTSTIRVNVGAWYFCVGRYIPSTELKVWKNLGATANTTGVPAALTNSTAALTIGAYAGGYNLLDGRAAHCFLCANAIPDTLITSLFQQTRGLFGV